jgi:hypothetical protein
MSNNLVQLGTIISSVLNYDQLNDSLGEPRGCHQNSTYAPCDGRAISGSRLANATDRNQVPDLRGQFIRGLNSFHLEGQPEIDPSKSDPDGLNRKVGSYQSDLLANHLHSANSNSGFAHVGGPGMGMQSNEGQEFQFITPSISVDAFGGAETRPKNVTVYFYIKIN